MAVRVLKFSYNRWQGRWILSVWALRGWVCHADEEFIPVLRSELRRDFDFDKRRLKAFMLGDQEEFYR